MGPAPDNEAPSEALEALDRVIAALGGAGEARVGQRQMVRAVESAMSKRRHLIVQAQTGTGKSLAYLVPALVSGNRVVVATATKALQDQLAHKDLPFLAETIGLPVDFALLKGRSNYLCRQRADEIIGSGDQLSIDATGDPAVNEPGAPGVRAAGMAGVAGMVGVAGMAGVAGTARDSDSGVGALGREVRRLVDWAATTATGERSELAFEPSARAWAQVSVGTNECPGAARCPSGEQCFAEAARRRAAVADVIVVNTHLYATHLASGGAVLPAHDVVIFDEAHEIEDVVSASFGLELGERRLSGVARSARAVVDDALVCSAVDDAGVELAAVIAPHAGRRVIPGNEVGLSQVLVVCRERLSRLLAAIRSSEGDAARKARASKAVGLLMDDLDRILDLPGTHVAWVDGPEHSRLLKVAPVEVGPSLTRLLWEAPDAPTTILTSATIPPALGMRLGLAEDTFDTVQVPSPFDFGQQALLYCAAHLPDPRSASYEAAMHDELAGLIDAAGGRTLALFTSWRSMTACAEALRRRVDWPILTQSDLPKPALIARFSEEEHSCLFATMGFWQGVDVPGAALSLVSIDRIPFPRPDEPLLQARRDRLGPRAFESIDLPRAATLMAQGAGRLIRTSTDRGVVAVLDPRLAKARYRWDLVRAMPPMARTRNHDEVVKYLEDLASGYQVGAGLNAGTG